MVEWRNLYSLLSEPSDNTQKLFDVGKDEHVDRRTLSGKRRAIAKEKGTVVIQPMVQEVQKAGIQFDYVLFETWFSNPTQCVALKDICADVIAIIMKNKTR